jgi:hypothetical protein
MTPSRKFIEEHFPNPKYTVSTRREFLAKTGMGFGLLSLTSLLRPTGLLAVTTPAVSGEAAGFSVPVHFPAKAKHVIHIFLSGGPSHVDTFDHKSELAKYDGKTLPEGNYVGFASPFRFDRCGKSGLGFSDIGNPAILGGLSREFYHRVYQHYQNDAAWDQEPRSGFKHGGQGTAALDPKTELASVFEPKVAEAVFDAMVKEAGVEVIKGRMDLARGVEKSGARISAIRIEGGVIVKGKMFIDASYEGEPARSMGALRHPHRLRIDPHGAGVHGIGAKRGHGGLSGDRCWHGGASRPLQGSPRPVGEG